MNREDRLRAAAPGASPELIAALAGLPAAQVQDIAALARQAGRDRLQADKDRKRQRRADARNHAWYDETQLTARTLAVMDSAGRRGRNGNLDALAALSAFARHARTLIPVVVHEVRPHVSDAELADALGVSVQAIHKRYGPRDGDMPELGPQSDPDGAEAGHPPDAPAAVSGSTQVESAGESR